MTTTAWSGHGLKLLAAAHGWQQRQWGHIDWGHYDCQYWQILANQIQGHICICSLPKVRDAYNVQWQSPQRARLLQECV